MFFKHTRMSKNNRYKRIYKQIEQLIDGCSDDNAKMCTIAAVLHHKMDNFFWTGFYLLKNGELTVANYQGPVACMILEKNKGVCWEGINTQKPVVVENVHEFPNHIACDARSNSEIVIPIFKEDKVVGVLDIDSKEFGNFDAVDATWLQKIVGLLFN